MTWFSALRSLNAYKYELFVSLVNISFLLLSLFELPPIALSFLQHPKITLSVYQPGIAENKSKTIFFYSIL